MKSQIGHNSQWKIAMWLKMTLDSRFWIDWSQVTTKCSLFTMVMQLKMVIDSKQTSHNSQVTTHNWSQFQS